MPADLNFARDMQGPPKSKEVCPCDERAAAGAGAEVTVKNVDLERDVVLRSSHERDNLLHRLKSIRTSRVYPRPGKGRLPCSPLLIPHLQLARKEAKGFLA